MQILQAKKNSLEKGKIGFDFFLRTYILKKLFLLKIEAIVTCLTIQPFLQQENRLNLLVSFGDRDGDAHQQ
jgi:hypothetical protein